MWHLLTTFSKEVNKSDDSQNEREPVHLLDQAMRATELFFCTHSDQSIFRISIAEVYFYKFKKFSALLEDICGCTLC